MILKFVTVVTAAIVGGLARSLQMLNPICTDRERRSSARPLVRNNKGKVTPQDINTLLVQEGLREMRKCPTGLRICQHVNLQSSPDRSGGVRSSHYPPSPLSQMLNSCRNRAVLGSEKLTLGEGDPNRMP